MQKDRDMGPQGDSYSTSRRGKGRGRGVTDNLRFRKSRTLAGDSHMYSPFTSHDGRPSVGQNLVVPETGAIWRGWLSSIPSISKQMSRSLVPMVPCSAPLPPSFHTTAEDSVSS